MFERILGLDLSLASAGWASGQQLGAWQPPKGLQGGQRLAWFRDHLTAALAVVRPGFVVVEGYAFSRQMQGARAIAELRGVVDLAVWDWGQQHGQPRVLEVPPTSLKAFVLDGQAEKDEMRLWAFKRWGVEHRSNDAVDAACLAKFGEAVLVVESALAHGRLTASTPCAVGAYTAFQVDTLLVALGLLAPKSKRRGTKKAARK